METNEYKAVSDKTVNVSTRCIEHQLPQILSLYSINLDEHLELIKKDLQRAIEFRNKYPSSWNDEYISEDVDNELYDLLGDKMGIYLELMNWWLRKDRTASFRDPAYFVSPWILDEDHVVAIKKEFEDQYDVPSCEYSPESGTGRPAESVWIKYGCVKKIFEDDSYEIRFTDTRFVDGQPQVFDEKHAVVKREHLETMP